MAGRTSGSGRSFTDSVGSEARVLPRAPQTLPYVIQVHHKPENNLQVGQKMSNQSRNLGEVMRRCEYNRRLRCSLS